MILNLAPIIMPKIDCLAQIMYFELFLQRKWHFLSLTKLVNIGRLAGSGSKLSRASIYELVL